MSRFIDLTGQRFGKLTVTALYKSPKKKTMWTCKCDCGSTTLAQGGNLKNGHTSSCGCGRNGHNKITHGHKSRSGASPTYASWRMMHNRCENPNVDNYKYYGGRGITVCPEWDSFETFLKDMGERPENTTLDRVDNDLGYYPANCQWANKATQSINRTYHRDYWPDLNPLEEDLNEVINF